MNVYAHVMCTFVSVFVHVCMEFGFSTIQNILSLNWDNKIVLLYFWLLIKYVKGQYFSLGFITCQESSTK